MVGGESAILPAPVVIDVGRDADDGDRRRAHGGFSLLQRLAKRILLREILFDEGFVHDGNARGFRAIGSRELASLHQWPVEGIEETGGHGHGMRHGIFRAIAIRSPFDAKAPVVRAHTGHRRRRNRRLHAGALPQLRNQTLEEQALFFGRVGG
ncbi:MAG: hypothetical protein WDO56_32955 [Gammaproteobacteria bacterium]